MVDGKGEDKKPTLHRNEKRQLQRALARARVEKFSEMIPCKLPFSIALWLKKRDNMSKFVREAVVERLERMVESNE